MYFPVFIDLTGKKLLVVGGGSVAARRVRVLADFTDEITVIAPQVSREILDLKQSFASVLRESVCCAAPLDEAVACVCGICLYRRPFRESDLNGHDLVFAATDDPALNRRIGALCRNLGIPVNVCSDQTLCDFQFPSVVQDGDVVVGINASGRDHALVKKMRRRIEAVLGVETERSKYQEG